MRPPLVLALPILLALAVPSVYIVSRGGPRNAPWLFKFAWLAAVAVLSLPVSVVLHNVVGSVLGVEEPVFFLLALASLPAFALGVIGTLGCLVFHRGG